MPYRDAIAFAAEAGIFPRHVMTLLAFQIGSVAFEGIGIAMMIPVFQFVQSGGVTSELTQSAIYWRWIDAGFRSIGLPVTLAGLLIVSFAAIIARQVFTFCRQVYEGEVQETAVRQLRNKQFQLFVEARQTIQDASRLGEMVNDVVVETPRAVSSIIFIVRIAGTAFLLAFYVALLAVLSPLMTITAFLTMGVSVSLVWGLLARSQATSARMTQANKTMASFLAERLRAARLIRLSQTEKAEVSRMEVLTKNQLDQILRFQRLSAAVGTMMDPIVIAIGLGALYIAVTIIHLPIEIVGIFLLILVRLLPAATEGVRMHNVLLGFSGSLRAVSHRITQLRSARELDSGTTEFSGLRKGIRLVDVWFNYESESAALQGVTLALPAGSITALVGPSGSGKSTLIDLLPRLREATRGKIWFDETPLAQFSLNSLRNGIAYVPQSPQLFNVTVRDHIRYGSSDINEAGVREAARLAGASEFIERLPNAYDTVLGEAGLRLSGGQRQRLDIARALARKASLLILDEPTSNLDAGSESALRETLRRIRRETKTTVIVIAHRLSSILEADQIAVLQNGRISGIGSHHELLQTSAWYRDAFAAQTSAEPAVAAC